MQNQMLSIIPDPAKQAELRSLFAQYPFQEMSKQFARAENCGGITFDDGSIYILPAGNTEWLLQVYLHEVAHAALIRSGHPKWHLHCDDFVKLARGMQARFGVAHAANHAYDQQDAIVKTSAKQARVTAHAAAMAIQFDPTQRAMHAAIDAVRYERGHNWRYVLIVGGAAILSMVIFTQPVGQWWNALMTMLDGDAVKLVGGAGLVAWLWWNLRHE